jgi:hypothetical protein
MPSAKIYYDWYNNLPLSNGTPVDIISWQLDDYSMTALSSDRLPAGPPVLENWEDDWGLNIHFGYKGGSVVGIKANSVQLVPEPTTVSLFAMVSLVLLKRRRW